MLGQEGLVRLLSVVAQAGHAGDEHERESREDQVAADEDA